VQAQRQKNGRLTMLATSLDRCGRSAAASGVAIGAGWRGLIERGLLDFGGSGSFLRGGHYSFGRKYCGLDTTLVRRSW